MASNVNNQVNQTIAHRFLNKTKVLAAGYIFVNGLNKAVALIEEEIHFEIEEKMCLDGNLDPNDFGALIRRPCSLLKNGIPFFGPENQVSSELLVYGQMAAGALALIYLTGKGVAHVYNKGYISSVSKSFYKKMKMYGTTPGAELRPIDRLVWAAVGAAVGAGIGIRYLNKNPTSSGLAGVLGVQALPLFTFTAAGFARMMGGNDSNYQRKMILKLDHPDFMSDSDIENEPEYKFYYQAVVEKDNILSHDAPCSFKMKCHDGKSRTFKCLTAAVLAQKFVDAAQIDLFCELDAEEARAKDRGLREMEATPKQKKWSKEWDTHYVKENRIASDKKVSEFWLFNALKAKFAESEEARAALYKDPLSIAYNFQFNEAKDDSVFEHAGDFCCFIRQTLCPVPDESKPDPILSLEGSPCDSPSLIDTLALYLDQGADKKNEQALKIEYPEFMVAPTAKPDYAFYFQDPIGPGHILSHDAEFSFNMTCRDERVRSFKCVTAAVLAQKFMKSAQIAMFSQLDGDGARKKEKELRVQFEANEATKLIDRNWDTPYVKKNTVAAHKAVADFWLFNALKAKFGQCEGAKAALLKHSGQIAYNYVFNPDTDDIAFKNTNDFYCFIRGRCPNHAEPDTEIAQGLTAIKDPNQIQDLEFLEGTTAAKVKRRATKQALRRQQSKGMFRQQHQHEQEAASNVALARMLQAMRGQARDVNDEVEFGSGDEVEVPE